MDQLISEAVVAAGKKKAKEVNVEFLIPPWLQSVPEDRQESAICGYHVGVRRFLDRAAKVKWERARRKAERREIVQEINKRGYDLTYMKVYGYVVAIAYRSVHEDEKWGRRMDCHFTVCSRADRGAFSREKSRKRLLDRIHINDSKFGYHCVAPSTESDRLDLYAKRRFLERVETDDRGLPYRLVQEVRHPEKPLPRSAQDLIDTVRSFYRLSMPSYVRRAIRDALRG